ncbi:hypothetical protein [uncultured Clostridium sp.]|uniref:hypothetical protein n=1 Tax=uncultured Clostridium sp. TaxID=59620 RepID=UPI002671B1AA|nr:hypothetical protein [uncultured Clostridium sp.]
MSENNNKGSVLVSIGLVIVTTMNILDKLIELNEFVAVGLDLIALVCFIVYLVGFFRNKK